MTTESLEELRQRLLHDESVQEMIHARAFEIYHMRGVQTGSAAQDWFQAESEVLAFLLAHQPEQVTEEEPVAATPTVAALSEATTSKKRKPRSASKQTATKKAATTKQTKPKKAPVSKSKSKRPRKEST